MRLADGAASGGWRLSVPAGGHGMFETLHGFADVAALSVELKQANSPAFSHSEVRGGPRCLREKGRRWRR